MSTTAHATPLQAHEAWLYGADRRLDLLAVPAFHAAPAEVAGWHAPQRRRAARLHELSTHWPQPPLALSAHLAGRPLAPALPVLQALLLLLRHLASPSRWEPLNTYPLHRDVPSPRGSFPLRLQLVLRGPHGPAQRYAYLPEHHALEPLGADAAAQALARPDSCTLLVVAPIWALADKYGEFAPYAQMLEAGMLWAQGLHLVAAAGWGGAPLPAAELAGAAPPQPWEVPAWGWRGQVPGLAQAVAALPLKASRVADSRAAADLAGRFPRLQALVRAFAPGAGEVDADMGATADARGHAQADAPAGAQPAAPVPAPVGPAGAVPCADADLFALMRRRSAGNDAVGMAARLDPLPAHTSARLLATTRALAARRGAVPGEAGLHPVLAWLDGPQLMYTLDGAARPHPTGADLADVLQAALPHPGLRWNLRPFKAALIVTAPPAASHAPGALRRLHLAAGALAQDFSLAATAEGLAARPMRMLAEQALQRGLGLPGLPLYVVLCARNRSTNLSWELL